MNVAIPQKIIQVGNSLAVTLPYDFVKRHRLKAGKQVVSRSVNGEIKYAIQKGKMSDYQEISDKEFIELIKQVESQYGPALARLAKLP